MKHKKVTRGFGVLETILAKKRAKIADKLIKQELREGRILDIGCGLFPYFLVSTNFNEKHGLDFSVDRSGFENNEIFLKEVDIEKQKIPYPDNHFNAIIMLAVFEHIQPEKLPNLLKDIHRVLKKNGVFIITTPPPWSAPILSTLSKVNFISKVEINDHKILYSPKKLSDLLSKTGFPKERIKKGYFEAFLNMWFSAEKA